MKNYIIISLIFITTLSLQAQERQETIIREISIQPNTIPILWIDNINGNITVQDGSTDKIILEIRKQIIAESDNNLQIGWEELNPVVTTNDDSIEVYINGFCECDCDKRDSHYWHRCDEGPRPYDFNFDFQVRVPKHINLRLATINKGEIRVNGTNGKIKVNNVNGGIFLNGVSGTTKVHTINGDVEVKYTKNPDAESHYYTLNGKLTVYFLPDLSADLNLKSFNGEFFTDFEISEYLPSRLVSNKTHQNGTSWQIENRTSIRIGNGGLLLNLETFNGDIYIKRADTY
jgi:hypothetical protein